METYIDPNLYKIIPDEPCNIITGGDDMSTKNITVNNTTPNIPLPTTSQFSECRLDNGKVCMSRQMLELLAGRYGFNSGETSDIQIVSEAMRATGCDSEKCIVAREVESGSAPSIELLKYKTTGPQDVSLLNNQNIDQTLIAWHHLHNEFFPYNFNMANYNKYSIRGSSVVESPDSLAVIDIRDLYVGNKVYAAGIEFSGEFRCAACVVNTDKYQGSGKHWMALFVDMRGRDLWTVEFFNSSGNAPSPEWVEWLNKSKFELEALIIEKNLSTIVKVVRVCDMPQQKSKTECGVYSLFYIWARIHGVPYTYFSKHRVPDQMMFMARGLFFHDSNFNWKYFNKLTENPDFIHDVAAAGLTVGGKTVTSKNIFGIMSDKHSRYILTREILGIKKLSKYFEFDYEIYKKITNIQWE